LDGGATDGDAAEEVEADVVSVGVDEVFGDAGEVDGGGDEGCGVGCGIEFVERRGDGGGVVDGPLEGEGAALGGVERGDDGRGDGLVADGVGGEEDVEGEVAPSADVDDFGLVLGEGPGAVGVLELGLGAVVFTRIAEMLDDDILNVGAGVGEAPSDELVAACDDEGNAGEGEAGDVESCADGGGGICGGVDVKGGFVPDVGGG
jgi:hypothetical protein